MIHRLPVSLEVRPCANGEAKECFLVVGEEPVYGPAGVGAFLSNPTPAQALAAAIQLTTRIEVLRG